MNLSRNILVLFVAYLAVFAESRVGWLRGWLGAQVGLLPSLLVVTGLTCNLSVVVWVSVFGGLWQDSLSANPLGLSMLPLVLTGVSVHACRGVILRGDLGTQYLLGLAASGLVPLLTLGLLIAAGEGPLYGGWFIWRWLVSAALGAALTPLFLRLFTWMDRAFNYRLEPSVSFRPDREIDRGRDPHAHS